MIPQHQAFLLPPSETYSACVVPSPDGRCCLLFDLHTDILRIVDLETGDVRQLSARHKEFPHTDTSLRSVLWPVSSHLLFLYEEFVPPGHGQTTTVLRSFSLDTEETEAWSRVNCQASVVVSSVGALILVEDGQLKRFAPELQLTHETDLPVSTVPLAMAAKDHVVALLWEGAMGLYDLNAATWIGSWERQESPHRHDTQEFPGEERIAVGTDGKSVVVGCSGQYLQHWSDGRCMADVPLFLREGQGYVLTVSRDGSFALWGHLVFALPGLQRRLSLQSGNELFSSGILHPQRQQLLIGDGGTLQLWDVEGMLQQSPPLGPQQRTTVMCCSHDQRWLAVGTDRRLVFLYDLDGMSLRHALEVGTSTVNSLAFHPNGRHLLVPQMEGEIGVWDIHDGTLSSIWRGLPFAHPGRTAWDQDGRTLMIKGHQNVVLVDVEERSVSKTLGPFLDPSRDYGYGPSPLSVDDADIHPSGRWVSICLGYNRNEAIVIDVETGEEIETFAEARLARFGGDGASLLICDGRETRGFSWPLTSREAWMRRQRCSDIAMVSTTAGHGAILCDHKELTLVSLEQRGGAGSEASFEEWEMRFYDGISALAVSPQRGQFYTGGDALWIGQRDLWDQGSLQHVFPAGVGHKVSSLAFDSTGQHLLAGEMDGRLHIWDIKTYSRVGFLDTTSRQEEDSPMEIGSLGDVEWLRFLPASNALLAIGSEWFCWPDWQQSMLSDEPEQIWEEPPYDLRQLSPCGRWLLSGSSYGEDLELWDTQTQEQLHAFATGLERTDITGLSDDGTLVICGGHEGQHTVLQAWSGETGALLHTLRVDTEVHGCAVTSAKDVLLWMQTSTTRIEAAQQGPGSTLHHEPDEDEYDEAEEGKRRGLMVLWDLEEGTISRFFDASLIPDLCRAKNIMCPADAPHVLLFGADGLYHQPAVIDISNNDGGPLLSQSTSHFAANAISRDGDLIATADWAGEIKLWSRQTGQCIAIMCCTTDGGWWSRTIDGAEDIVHTMENNQ